MTTILVLGGARSGKTAYAQARAQALAAEASVRPTMIVIAQALDDEIQQRFQRHQADRGGRSKRLRIRSGPSPACRRRRWRSWIV